MIQRRKDGVEEMGMGNKYGERLKNEDESIGEMIKKDGQSGKQRKDRETCNCQEIVR